MTRTALSARTALSSRAAAAGLLIALTVAGCSAPQASDSETTAPSASGSREITADSSCAAGEDVVISAKNSSAVLTGDCGTVTLSGSDVHANIDSAKKLVVTGSGAAVIGKKWDAVETTGAKASLNADEIATLTVSGADTTVTLSRKAGKVTLGADGGSLNAHDVQALTVTGDRNTVVLSGTLSGLTVSGDTNTFNWSSGVKLPGSDTGKDNTYTR
ncbi:DUF3060 domain-containing protein [Arthrobacter sp. Y-9]|uniref:DUF3060 domain-containing protein n=1 Tax=Arthrobacter sp. Y-9 TaxID=3039385 RepID=UPI00241CA872|nr:DUF3060 domain-containing protein [Arthrobacter sp. Y-9]WFR83419.1 DUF3060 domain-containing protein [Arthrobacter sp. Y-9]